MSYVTVEVEIDHGTIVAKEPGSLPEKASGLLTILPWSKAEPSQPMTQLEALLALQKNLNLDDAKVQAWKETIRDARR
jgi:hypothetical protein